MNHDLITQTTKLIRKLTDGGRYQEALLVAEITANMVEIKNKAKSLEDKWCRDEYGYMAVTTN